MVGLVAILRALARVRRRELHSLLEIRSNNFFVFAVVVFTSGLSGELMGGTGSVASSTPLLVAVGLIGLLSLSINPIGKVPSSRLRLWPLESKQQEYIKVLTRLLNPTLWLALLVLTVRLGPVRGLLVSFFVTGLQAAGGITDYLFSRLRFVTGSRHALLLPGRLGVFAGLTVKQVASTLDFYLALLLCVSGLAYRYSHAHPDPAARPAIAMLMALVLSTCAQALFGMEEPSSLSRYRIFPVSGWQIVLAKDVGYLAVLASLLAAFDFASGLAFGFAAIALGRYPSLRLIRRQPRWGFTSGDLRFGSCQVLLGSTLGLATARFGILFLLIAAVLYGASVFWGGRLWNAGIANA